MECMDVAPGTNYLVAF